MRRAKFAAQRGRRRGGDGDGDGDGDDDGRARFDDGNGDDDDDDAFCEALEWGLPPTGGWGCGVDRLAMLFAGRDRISDVLAFGTVRKVAGGG